MHRIIKSHLDSFINSNGLNSHSESEQFEMFVNFAIISSKMAGTVDIDNITTGKGDDGTDGLAIIINEELVLSDSDAASILSTERKNNDVDLIFVQSKTSESFDLGDFLKFQESILRFVDEEDYMAIDEVQTNARRIFDVIVENVPRIRNGKPSVIIRYVTTGIYKQPEALEKAKLAFIDKLSQLGYFDKIDLQFIDRNQMTKVWVDTYAGVISKLPMISNAPFPPIDGIEEAYVAIVRAKDFIDELLTNEEGNLRNNVFEENVRAFLGVENPINIEIAKTINSANGSSRFPVLNNGITIVSEDVRVQGNMLHLHNFQIVNGCQTSNVLFENKEIIDNELMINIKVVETTNEDVFSELVRATNSQTKVDETQFLSLRPISKRIEDYFNTYDGQDGRLYFERRDKQYANNDFPNIRIFSLNIAAKAVCAMFLERPDLSFRYPKRMYELYTDEIFSEDIKEIVFYTASLALYRLYVLVAKADVQQNARKYKWHTILLLRVIVGGKELPKLNSKKMETYCQKIIDVCAKSNEEITDIYNKALKIITSVEDLTDDRLKRQAIMNEMIETIK